jgi:hypothetical protein
MTAFARTWSLIKMPVVPGSLSTDGEHPTALFDDPISGERLPLHVKRELYRGQLYGLTGYILKPEGMKGLNERGSPRPNDIRSAAHFKDEDISWWEQLESLWTSSDTNTNDEYQRRGYATALYDVIAHLINQRGQRIAPSAEQTPQGVDFWDRAEKTGKSNDYRWRVRDDL